jgi:hypothetical protein
VNAGFFYKSASEREKLVAAEREFTDEKVKKIIELKKSVCKGTNKGFVVVNQKVIILLNGMAMTEAAGRQTIGQTYCHWGVESGHTEIPAQ